jgi:fatty acid desaturase
MNDSVKEPLPECIKNFLILNKLELKKLSKPNVWISLGQIAFEYILIASAIFICIKFWSIPLYILTLMFIGSRQHGLGVLLHDATHYLLCKNKKLNDFIATVFLSFPTFTPLSKYRHSHFNHHRAPLTDEDPDWIPRKENSEWVFPKSKINFVLTIFQYAFFIHMFKNIFNFKTSIKEKLLYIGRAFITLRVPKKQPNQYKGKNNFILNILFYVFILFLMIYLNIFNYFLLFWIFPILFWIPFIHRLRSVAEHIGLKNDSIYTRSRTMYSNLFERFFLGCNWNCLYHLDHHIFPKIPSYRLKKLHNMLLSIPEFSEKAHITKNGYYGVFKECTI